MPENSLNINFEEYRLDNGLNVILSADSSIPSTAINLCYKVGSKDEEPDKRGIAHLFEHLMYEGSKHIPQGAYDKYCQMAGGENNGYTSEDKTNYFIVLPSHNYELGLWLESDRMFGFSVTEESLLKQKEVIIEEKKQIFDNKPYGTLSLEFPPRLFKEGGYSWDTIGVMEEISSATMEDLRKFFYRYYVPNNAYLSITGDIEVNKVKESVKKFFGDIKPGNIERKNPFENNYHPGEITETIYDNVQFPGLFIGYRIPGEKTNDRYIMDILSDILSMGESSKLYRRLVYDKKMCSEAGCYTDIKEFAGVLYIFAILMPGIKIIDVKKEIDVIISDVLNGNITENELEKVKNRIETRHAYRMQSIVHKADLLAHYKAFYNEAGMMNSIINKYLLITIDEVLYSANKFLKKDNRVVLQYLPRK